MAENKLLTEIELKNRLEEYWVLYCDLWNNDDIDESDYESGFDYWALEAQHDKTLAKIREVVEGAGLKLNRGGILSDVEVEYYNRGAKAQLAKLKAMGYEQVWTKCPGCDGRALKAKEAELNKKIPDDLAVLPMDADCPTCKGTGKITNKVEWDREKVAEELGSNLYCDFELHLSHKEELELADQLKDKLTGVNNE